MAEIKGKYITLVGLLQYKTETYIHADEYVEKETGYKIHELPLDMFFDTNLFHEVLEMFVSNQPDPVWAKIYFGSRILPFVLNNDDSTEVAHLKTPFDFLKFETDLFLQTHRGEELPNRRIISHFPDEITVYAPGAGYDSIIYEGICQSVFEMLNITNWSIKKLGGHTFRIRWKN